MDDEEVNIEDGDEMVDDFYLINGAERSAKGRFAMWYKRRFYTDGRKILKDGDYMRLAIEAKEDADMVAAAPSLEGALQAVRQLRSTTDRLEIELVAYARGRGWSWRMIAETLGVSVSAVHKRFAQLEIFPRKRSPVS